MVRSLQYQVRSPPREVVQESASQGEGQGTGWVGSPRAGPAGQGPPPQQLPTVWIMENHKTMNEEAARPLIRPPRPTLTPHSSNYTIHLGVPIILPHPLCIQGT